MNAKTKKTPIYAHEWDFEKLSKILNLSLKSSYFKQINMLKTRILEPVKKDLEKFNAQNPELEKVPTKKEYKVYADKSKPIVHNLKQQKNKIIEKPILNDEQLQNILENIDGD